MKTRRWIATMFLPLTLVVLATSADAQGKGKGKEQGADKAGQGQARGRGKSEKGAVVAPKTAPGQQKQEAAKNAGQMRAVANNGGVARGRSAEHAGGNAAHSTPASAYAAPRASVAAAPNRGRAVSRFARDLHVSEVRPVVRTYVVSNRPAQFVTGGAVAYALARGTPENTLLVVPTGNVVILRNRRGAELISLDDDRARTLGVWQVTPLNEQVKNGSPSFCRSGAGHPVWGRQWCLDKGFGLGTQQNVRWGTTRDVGDIIYGRRVTSGNLTRDVLLNLLGPVAYDRLALHAVTLGYTDPLTGVWHSEATGPDVLLVNSGTYPIAEFVDANRDQRPDLMLVALRPW